jgi:dihydroceramidase
MATLASALLSRADHATAAIDWCEANFATHPALAEFWNALSSLAFCACGLSLSLQDSRLPRLRAPLRCAGPLIFCLGLASAAYHATLQLPYQRLDEVMENAALVSLLHGALPQARAWSPLAFAVHSAASALGVLRVHRFLFTELHLIAAALGVGAALQWLAARAGGAAGAGAGARLRVAAGAAALGALAWLADRLACPALQALPLGNPQLHAWWHLAGALALHEAFAAAALAGGALDGGRPSLRVGALGLLSVVVEEEEGGGGAAGRRGALGASKRA